MGRHRAGLHQHDRPAHGAAGRGEVLAKVAERAGLHASPHTLRHSYVSMMIEAGVPIRVVSELVGHASTALTSDLYGHVTERVNREATDRLGEVLTRARARR